ncbi:MAG TPA: 16S rRNA (cytidine(1402)-2'-O)-methyltransferase [Bacteroidales bacterium]|nr:16S rRNA (cytidine(1402)-2'-O)-methyltransferase [Bacteroidales bacterium]HPT09247.1 16S rRNA (cytidine(1402)-2'-O)-methyltransferase [Bacteroidales bacterium]
MNPAPTNLYIVPTPIGNLEDMTFRAVRILKEVNVILAEDTRTTSKLLHHYGIENKTLAHHQFNEHKTLEKIIDMLLKGETFALVTDAGTPGISDPGFLLIRACIRENLKVECLPGATAFVPALVSSGIACDHFVFEGFLPHKKGRHTRLTFLAEEERTIVLYESPHRLVKSLQQMTDYFGEKRNACVCRELTKVFEEIARGTLKELAEWFNSRPVKGEIVIVVEGKK